MHLKQKQLPYAYSLLLCLILLIFCNVLFFKIAGTARIFVGAGAYLSLLLIYKLTDLQLPEIGLAKSSVKPGLVLAAKISAIYSLFLAVAYIFFGGFFDDPRYQQSVLAALFWVIMVLPFQTVLFEEFAFRGVLPALLVKIQNVKFAIIGSSVLFGLWHLITALSLSDSLKTNGLTIPSTLILLGVFAVTSFLGMVLCYLRYRSGSLLTPIIAHWFINASGILLAALSWS